MRGEEESRKWEFWCLRYFKEVQCFSRSDWCFIFYSWYLLQADIWSPRFFLERLFIFTFCIQIAALNSVSNCLFLLSNSIVLKFLSISLHSFQYLSLILSKQSFLFYLSKSTSWSVVRFLISSLDLFKLAPSVSYYKLFSSDICNFEFFKPEYSFRSGLH